MREAEETMKLSQRKPGNVWLDASLLHKKCRSLNVSGKVQVQPGNVNSKSVPLLKRSEP